MAHTVTENTSVNPQVVVDAFCRAYRLVHKRDPLITHLFDDWYRVNGETVHRLTLFHEITRLRDLAQNHRLMSADKSVVQRLIARLRNL